MEFFSLGIIFYDVFVINYQGYEGLKFRVCIRFLNQKDLRSRVLGQKVERI